MVATVEEQIKELSEQGQTNGIVWTLEKNEKSGCIVRRRMKAVKDGDNWKLEIDEG